MKDNKIREEVESYLNGNISTFKAFLKRCSKVDLINAIYQYHYLTGEEYHIVLSKFEDYIKGDNHARCV